MHTLSCEDIPFVYISNGICLLRQSMRMFCELRWYREFRPRPFIWTGFLILLKQKDVKANKYY